MLTYNLIKVESLPLHLTLSHPIARCRIPLVLWLWLPAHFNRICPWFGKHRQASMLIGCVLPDFRILFIDMGGQGVLRVLKRMWL